MLQQLDMHWREHLAGMDYLRQGIYLRAYAQKNPKQEYKREAFALFTAMLDRIRSDTVMLLQRLQVRTEEEIEREEAERRRRLQSRMQLQHAAPPELAAQVPLPRPPRPSPICGRRIARRRPARCHSSAASVRSAATSPVPAARAASSSIATERCSRPAARLRRDGGGRTTDGESFRNSCHCRRDADAQGRVLIAQRPRGRHMAGPLGIPGRQARLRRGPVCRTPARTRRGTRRDRARGAAADTPAPRLPRSARAARRLAGHRLRGRAAGARLAGARLGAARRTAEARPARSRPRDRDGAPAPATRARARERAEHCSPFAAARAQTILGAAGERRDRP